MRYTLFLLIMVAGISSQAQTLFTFGTNKVDKKEFWRAFSKNNNGATDEKSIREYLDLFIRFKLKVQAARDLKLDTLPNIINDIAGFRAQMTDQYIRNQGAGKTMVTEAIERSKTEVEAAHVFIAYGNDSAAAKKEIEKAYRQLQTGADFSKTAAAFSTDAFVKSNNGYIGYLTVFQLPYELENILYGLPNGSYSKPVAAANGYHILKVISKRSSPGNLKAAQILIATSGAATAQEIADAKGKAEMIYQLLKNGEKFEELAVKYSDDKTSYAGGGVMREFNFTTYDVAFSKAAFSLQNDGDFSKPVQTASGFHIIKRLGLKQSAVDVNDPVVQQEYTEKVNADARMNIAIAQMQKQILKASGYTPLPYNEKQLWVLTDTMLKAKNYAAYFKSNQSKPLFKLKDKTVTVTDWLKFAKSRVSVANSNVPPDYKSLMKEFTETTAEQYYKDRLEMMNEEFRYQVKEFSEGSLLFEVMERTIWSVAPTDSLGLINYYNQNKTNYKWMPGATAIVFNCSDTAVANRAMNLMKKDPSKWKGYMNEFGGTALADSSRFEYSQLPVTGSANLTPGTYTPVVTNTNDGSASFCYIINVFNGNDQRSFDEAKGLVINDYQLLLEDKWINQLKKKYPVKVNEALVKGMVK
ncbi:MAG: peptidylprolyl isomerase [Chitinophagaceae bacterium]|nr:peptidylprolyl isomerase [Chitinophagaceae bacterium]